MAGLGAALKQQAQSKRKRGRVAQRYTPQDLKALGAKYARAPTAPRDTSDHTEAGLHRVKSAGANVYVDRSGAVYHRTALEGFAKGPPGAKGRSGAGRGGRVADQGTLRRAVSKPQPFGAGKPRPFGTAKSGLLRAMMAPVKPGSPSPIAHAGPVKKGRKNIQTVTGYRRSR